MTTKFDVKTEDLLVWKGTIVMSRTEEPFFETLFRKMLRFRPAHVLEVGYGLGISANLIQRVLKPRQHHIVEIDDVIYKDLRAFAVKRKNVTGIHGDFWSFRPRRRYDFIFYDPFDYATPSEGESETDYNRAKSERMQALLDDGGTVCCPHFGPGAPEPMPGFRKVVYEKLKVSPYYLDDGSITTRAAVVCWQTK